MDRNKEIKNKRLSLGLTQKEFADALGLGKNGERTLRRWENGETTPSPLEVSAILAYANELPFKAMTDYKFKFIDLFAGIGGIRIPFQELGGKCVFSSEWDKYAQKTYKLNFGEQPEGDITKIDIKEIPDCDILLAGFPCQPFSQAGLKMGFADTRGTLFFEIERILNEKRPKMFLLENVKQLQSHNNGETLKTILVHLKNLNYHVEYKTLKAKDFGVPQNRERIYIVGISEDYYNLPANYKFDFPSPKKIKTNVGSILEKKVDKKYTISNKLWEGHKRRKINNKNNGKGFGYSLVTSESEYTNTLSARYYKDGSEILVYQNKKNPRKLTPRECARLQGFPDKFIIPVSDTQAYKQFGNSVAVPVIKEIASKMLEQEKTFKKRKNIKINKVNLVDKDRIPEVIEAKKKVEKKK